MYDLLLATTVGVVGKQICCDLTQAEIAHGGAYLPIVIKARSEQVVFMQLDSTLSIDLLEETLEKGIQGCRAIRSYLENAMKTCLVEQRQQKSINLLGK